MTATADRKGKRGAARNTAGTGHGSASHATRGKRTAVEELIDLGLLSPPGATSTVTPAGIAMHDPDVIISETPTAPKIAIKMLRIDQIVYDDQKPDRELVKQLADALRRGEVLPPIQVTREAHVLIQGRHRMEAYRLVGYEEIPVVFRDLDDDLDRRRASTIEENLRRRRMSALEVFEGMAELKRLHKKLYPNSGRGGDRRSKAHSAPLIGEGKVEKADTFADRMAKVTGKSRAAINRAVAIGETLPQEVRDVVRGTILDDKPEEVAALAREARHDTENAVAAAKTVLAGEAKTVREALRPGDEPSKSRRRPKPEQPAVEEEDPRYAGADLCDRGTAGSNLRIAVEHCLSVWRMAWRADASNVLAACILEAIVGELRDTIGQDGASARQKPR